MGIPGCTRCLCRRRSCKKDLYAIFDRDYVDVTATMLEELDKAAQELNVSRQAVIKTLVRQALDQHYLAQRARRPQSAS